MKMYRFLLLVSGLLLSSQNTAQTLPRVSKDKEIGFINGHIGQSWDMLYNTDWGKGRNWDIKVPVQTGGLIIESGSNGEAYTTTHSPVRRSGKKKGIMPSEVNARLNENWEKTRAAQEAARIQKRIEADKREMQAKMQHAILTAPYYAKAATRDHWHATEGAHILSGVKSKEFHKLPEKQESSGADLAAGIKPKDKTPSKIEVVSLSVLMKDKKLDDSGQVKVTENLYFDEQQMQEWAAAVDEEGLFDISSLVMNTQEERVEPILLVSHEELELDSICPFVLPQYGLVALSGDSLILLKDDELRSVAWIEGCESSYVVVCGDKLIGKKGKGLNIIKDACSEKLLEFDTNQYSIFPGDSTSIYAVCWYENISSVIKVDVCKKEYNEIARLPLAVLNIAANENMTLALVENDVFLIEKEGKPLKFFKADDYINDIVMTEKGLLVATDANIILARNAHEQSLFLKEGAKRLWSDGKDIYFQNMNNNLYLIESK